MVYLQIEIKIIFKLSAKQFRVFFIDMLNKRVSVRDIKRKKIILIFFYQKLLLNLKVLEGFCEKEYWMAVHE